VQLIRADRDEHLWAESYSRSLNDILEAEGDVASAIAQQLNVKLTGAEQKALINRPTQNPAAYEAYLRAIAIEDTRAYWAEAVFQYEEATRLDPSFALAWARLAVCRSHLNEEGGEPETNTAAAVQVAVEKAKSLDPDSGESWLAEGTYRYRVLLDYEGALKAFQEARKRLPNSAVVLTEAAYLERRLGQWENALSHYRDAIKLDPRNVYYLCAVSAALLAPMRRFTEVHAMVDRAFEISPDDFTIPTVKAQYFQKEGRLAEAAQQLARIPADFSNSLLDLTKALQLSDERRFEGAIAQMELVITAETKTGAPTISDSIRLGYLQEWAGRKAEARRTFEHVVNKIKPSSDAMVPANMQHLPRYLGLAYAGLGEKELALAQARQAVKDYENDAIEKPHAEEALAQIQARFGDVDAAIALLSHLLEVPGGLTSGRLRVDPIWDPLRKDPRFRRLIAERPAGSN
jgi:tetratricopeptide (TPR) repeat protein